jgi:myosin-5
MLGNPVLESFGNAKTLRNDNSSRFGKWIEVAFDGSEIAGAGVKTFLLEKSRVVGQVDGERNFHIFYDLCAAAAAGESSVQGLGLCEAAEFANTKACTRAGARDDAAAFREIRGAMHQMGVGSEVQRSIFSGVTAILHLCSIEVGEENDFDGNSCATVNVQGASIQHAAKLLQVSAGELKEGLCTRLITTGREQMRKPENRERALLCLQALCKQLYSKIFERVVELVNAAMKVGAGAGAGIGGGGRQKHVAVLDIFGFESFAENRFEQLCINHANEKLQGHFNNYSFLQERALMEAEGLEVQTSDFVDNLGCIQMLEQAGGLQATLDDVCKMPKGDDKVLLDRLFSDKTLTGAGYLVLPKKKDGTFIIKHYAGSVAYTAEGFCERNKDVLPASAVVLLQASKDKLLSTLFEQVAAETLAGAASSSRGRGSVGGAGGKQSVSATFKADLNGLMQIINQSGPHFVRCINPNRHKQAQVFEDVKAVEQLRCGGVIEAMRMARASFPCRYSHDEFARTYVPFLCPEVATALPLRSKCVACFKALEATPGHFAVGKTLVLMRREVLDLLERRRGSILFRHAVAIQSASRALTARALLLRRRRERHELHALVRLQKVTRRQCVRAKYIRMVGIARDAAVAKAQAQKKAAQKAEEAKEREQAKAQAKSFSSATDNGPSTEAFCPRPVPSPSGSHEKMDDGSRQRQGSDKKAKDKGGKGSEKESSGSILSSGSISGFMSSIAGRIKGKASEEPEAPMHTQERKTQENDSCDYAMAASSDYTARRLAKGVDRDLFAAVGAGSSMSKKAWVSFEDALWLECEVRSSISPVPLTPRPSSDLLKHVRS